MLRVRLRLNNLEEVAGWVLSFGTHATVIKPKALADTGVQPRKGPGLGEKTP